MLLQFIDLTDYLLDRTLDMLIILKSLSKFVKMPNFTEALLDMSRTDRCKLADLGKRSRSHQGF